MKIFVIKDEVSKTRNESLKFVSTEAAKQKIISDDNIENLFLAFIEREKISTTGFQDHIAIPHAQCDFIKEPCVIVSICENDLEWETLDNSSIKSLISLLVPKDDVSTLHIDILSEISTLLLNDKFREILLDYNNKKSIIQKITRKINKDNNKIDKNKNQNDFYDVVGISSCATGVAHTYMAKEALESVASKMNLKIKIETQGQKGAEFILTDEEIKNAKAVIIASDIYVELDRFVGKKLLKIKTNDAIANPEKAVSSALEANVYSENNGSSSNNFNQTQFKSTKTKEFMGHLLSGVSRMIPFIVFSGLIWAIFNSISEAVPILKENQAFIIAKQISEIGFSVFIAMMGGFIAESIAGRAAFAPGFITTFAAANSKLYFWWNVNGMNGIPRIEYFFKDAQKLGIDNIGLSLFAAIMMGFASGYLVRWVNTWKIHKLAAPIIPIVFIPVVCSSVIVFPFTFFLSGSLGFMMNGLVYGIAGASKVQGVNFLMGFILGAMIGFDMGGPVNKIAATTSTALIAIDPRLMGAVAAAIPIAPLGCAFATFIGYKLFTSKERADGLTALGLGFFGISEGAIPFAVNRPKQVLIANIISSAIAGGIAFMFYCGGFVGMWGGPITALVLGEKAPVVELAKLGITIPDAFGGGGVPGREFISILWFFVAIFGSSLFHAFIFITMIKGKDTKFIKKIASLFNKKSNNNDQQLNR